MDFAVIPRLAHKRSRTPGNSLSGSPRASARNHGKRRATPADPRAMMAAGAYPPHFEMQQHDHPLAEEGTTSNRSPSLAMSSHHSRRKTKSSNKKKKVKEEPYYVDGRLDVKMYRGSGYERFPVVLGTVEGHQQICEKWDADKIARLQKKAAKLSQDVRGPTIIDDSNSDLSDDSTLEEKAAFEKRCLDSVLEVFPDLEHAYLKKKIQGAPPQQQYYDEIDDDIVTLGAPRLAETIIAEVLEMQSYPKERSSKSMTNGKGAADDGTGVTIAWDRDFPKDKMYKKDAVILIAKHFVNVPTIFVARMVEEKNSIFDTYVAIQELEDQYYTVQPRPYPRRREPRAELEKKYLLSISDRRIPAEYANRVNELQAAKQHVAREAIKGAAKKAKEEIEALNLAEHKNTGAIMECRCCFDDETPLNRAVPCTADEPHYFCFGCVEDLADTQVGMLKHEMLCMDASGCPAKLAREEVGKAIPITTFDRLELNQQQAEIMAANIEGLEQCPSCDYKAICGEVTDEPIFYCQNPDCSRASCRRCQKDNHAPQTCEEASVDKVLNARHLIEEARSEAIIRTCRKCKAKIVKEFGCNKMTCTRCGSLFCYNCNEELTSLGGNAYSHFGRKCILYDVQGADRHDKEADEAEKDAISKAKAMDAELDEKKLRIETGKAVKLPNMAMQNLQNHPAAGVFIQDLNNRAGRLNHRQIHLQHMQARVAQLEALRPDPELEAILADLHAIDGAVGMDNVPPPQVRLQQIQQLQDLQRRMRANLEQHAGPNAPPGPAGHQGRARNARPPAPRPFPNPARNPPPLPPAIRNAAVPPAGWPEDFDCGDLDANIDPAPLLDLPRNAFDFGFDFAGAQAQAEAAVPGPMHLAPNPPGNLANNFAQPPLMNFRDFQHPTLGAMRANVVGPNPHRAAAQGQTDGADANAHRRARAQHSAEREAALIRARVVQAQGAIAEAQEGRALAQRRFAQAERRAGQNQGTLAMYQQAIAQTEQAHAARAQAAQAQRDLAAAGIEVMGGYQNFGGIFVEGVRLPKPAGGPDQGARRPNFDV